MPASEARAVKPPLGTTRDTMALSLSLLTPTRGSPPRPPTFALCRPPRSVLLLFRAAPNPSAAPPASAGLLQAFPLPAMAPLRAAGGFLRAGPAPPRPARCSAGSSKWRPAAGAEAGMATKRLARCGPSGWALGSAPRGLGGEAGSGARRVLRRARCRPQAAGAGEEQRAGAERSGGGAALRAPGGRGPGGHLLAGRAAPQPRDQ